MSEACDRPGSTRLAAGERPGPNQRNNRSRLGCQTLAETIQPEKLIGEAAGSSAVHVTQTIRWTLRRRRNRKENRTPSISTGTAPAVRTGPRPAAAAQAIAATTRRRGVVAPTAMNPERIQAATTTMQQPPSSPTRTRGTPTTPGWPWPTTPTLPRPGAPQTTPTASSRTSVGIRETGSPGHGGAQRRQP